MGGTGRVEVRQFGGLDVTIPAHHQSTTAQPPPSLPTSTRVLLVTTGGHPPSHPYPTPPPPHTTPHPHLQRGHGDRQAEAVEQLRAQLALGRVAAANHDELGGVHDGDALALHSVLPARGCTQGDGQPRRSGCSGRTCSDCPPFTQFGVVPFQHRTHIAPNPPHPTCRTRVEHHVHQAVVQQVDLVDVQDAAVGPGQQPRLERLDALGQRLFDVNGAADAVLCRRWGGEGGRGGGGRRGGLGRHGMLME